ncbi:hypothetical protein PL8927_720332 [Planktothrix serta PCC 8927]|uniref:Uncharacterized protein n=1 Tax=Planktothrix serta PCC 8927 TaxID=671068 RepID=A0A7Z9BXW2_9CYAN|nr:hypothetical protein PL8927_720332 [Planktothrix serta PCC 8927]
MTPYKYYLSRREVCQGLTQFWKNYNRVRVRDRDRDRDRGRFR